MATSSSGNALHRLQEQHRACTACADAGYIAHAYPVFSGHAGQRFMVVGQAPGRVEIDQTRPFAGRAGKELMRWFARAGFGDEDQVREVVYFTAMATCFPGRARTGSGDRRPSAAEIALCSKWLDLTLELVDPKVVIPVGTLALGRFLPGTRLDEAVGRSFRVAGRTVIPLPHPSGQSRWLNDGGRRALLAQALDVLSSSVRRRSASAAEV